VRGRDLGGFVLSNQGEQSGRIFAQWAIVYFGQLIQSYIHKYPTFLG
jgi:hypothetical protein